MEPSNAIRSFELAPGIAIELVAAEPLVASPVAMTWDNEGRLFVVENRGYPTGMPNGSPGGQVVRLQDSDGDGTMDQRQVFADGFSFPNGITAWDGGFFVTCAPDIWFLKDTNGDGELHGERGSGIKDGRAALKLATRAESTCRAFRVLTAASRLLTAHILFLLCF